MPMPLHSRREQPAAQSDALTQQNNVPTLAESQSELRDEQTDTVETECPELTFLTPANRIVVHIQTRDLTTQDTEVIVNPANQYLRHGGGAAKAIADAAGQSLVDECNAYIEHYTALPNPYVTHTTSGNLPPPIRHVIHACEQHFHECHSQEQCLLLLQATFLNCLQYANVILGTQSIALPAISAGLFAILMGIVKRAICHAIETFDHHMTCIKPDKQRLHRIKIVNINRQATDAL